MMSRRYYGTAGSSFWPLLLLFWVACPSHGDKAGAPREIDPPVVHADQAKPDDRKAEAKQDDRKAEAKQDDTHGRGGETGEEPSGEKEPPDLGGGEKAGDEAGTPPKGPRPKGKDGCVRGQMRFEGGCLSKERVSRLLKQREAAAMEKVRKAQTSTEAGEAAYDLIQHHTQQMGKVEDDLDEIIEQLEKENKERDKTGGLP